jgi:hypothetical protein
VTFPGQGIHFLTTATLGAVLTAAVLSAAGPAVKPLDVGSERQLFIDHRFIASMRGVELVGQRPRPTGERLLVADRPWEDFWIGGYKTVYQEADRIHLWYEVCSKRDPRHGNSVAYAYSTDGGATFVKPELGVVEFDGSTRNNLVLRGIHAMHVAPNRPGAPPSERYILYAGKPNRAFVSPDGIRWTPSGSEPFLDTATYEHMTLDSQNVVFWDTRFGKYVLYARFNLPNNRGTSRIRRTFWRAESAIFGDFGPFAEVFAPDARDPVEFDWYTTAALQYTDAADAYFMWPAAYHHSPPPPTNDGPLDIQFASSRNGIHWHRPDRRPVIRLGGDGAWNGGSLYAGYGLTRHGDELSLYYTAYDATHAAYKTLDHIGGVITRAIYRLDGFMSLDAGYEVGEFTTPPLVFDGSRLELNFDGSAGGWCRVELRDAQGGPIPGFTESDADRISGNSTALAVTWGGRSDLSELRGRPVVLRFLMRDASLYAFQFR